LNNKKVVGLADGCNGLELYVLYVGFLLAFTAPKKDVLIYAILGIAVIFILNTLRCYAITLLNIHGSSLSEVAHHYIFKLLIYGVMFFLWTKYTKIKETNEA
jgi:exosortase/archaeosortase family protein